LTESLSINEFRIFGIVMSASAPRVYSQASSTRKKNSTTAVFFNAAPRENARRQNAALAQSLDHRCSRGASRSLTIMIESFRRAAHAMSHWRAVRGAAHRQRWPRCRARTSDGEAIADLNLPSIPMAYRGIVSPSPLECAFQASPPEALKHSLRHAASQQPGLALASTLTCRVRGARTDRHHGRDFSLISSAPSRFAETHRREIGQRSV
jgi:hypothetical protein